MWPFSNKPKTKKSNMWERLDELKKSQEEGSVKESNILGQIYNLSVNPEPKVEVLQVVNLAEIPDDSSISSDAYTKLWDAVFERIWRKPEHAFIARNEKRYWATHDKCTYKQMCYKPMPHTVAHIDRTYQYSLKYMIGVYTCYGDGDDSQVTGQCAYVPEAIQLLKMLYKELTEEE